MLTLGLAEGVLFSAAGLLVLLMALEMRAPLHRLLGPLVVGVMIAVGIGIAQSAGRATGPPAVHPEGAKRIADIAGLLFASFVLFLVPLMIMRHWWRSAKFEAQEAREPAKPAAPRAEIAPVSPTLAASTFEPPMLEPPTAPVKPHRPAA